MPPPPMLVLDTPPRWRGGVAVVVAHALLLVGLGQAHWTLRQPERMPAPHQAVSTLRMITIQLPPLRQRDATATPTPVPSGRGPERPHPRPHPARQRPLATDPSRATAAVDAAPVAAAAARAAVPRAPQAAWAASAPSLPLVADAQHPPPSAPALQSGGQPALQSAPHAASGPSGRELMDGAATRLAIRQSTRGAPLLSERADQASQAPERLEASARLGREIKDAGAGDCLKGEFAGGGMGLLSAPFLLLAQARGQCAK